MHCSASSSCPVAAETATAANLAETGPCSLHSISTHRRLCILSCSGYCEEDDHVLHQNTGCPHAFIVCLVDGILDSHQVLDGDGTSLLGLRT